MACYGCGSPEGNDAKLCPDCNQKRSEEHDARIVQLSTKVEDIPPLALTQQQKILLGVGSFFLLFGIWWLFAPAPAAAPIAAPSAVPTASPLEVAMSGCLRKTLGPSEVTPDEESLSHAAETCNIFKAPCLVSIESPECRSFVQEYGAPTTPH